MVTRMWPSCSSDLISCVAFLVVVSTIGWVRDWKLFFSFSEAKPSFILLPLLIMTDVVPLSAFLNIMFLSRDNCLSHCSSPGVRLGFGFSNWISASSNFTSSRKVSKATEGWTGGFQSDFTWNGCGCFFTVIYVLEAHSSRKEIKMF